jgi:hypothetical protein
MKYNEGVYRTVLSMATAAVHRVWGGDEALRLDARPRDGVVA